MYYEDDERLSNNPEFLYVVRHAINTNRFGLKYVPTHTEDGIPIRKLYVTNLPPKTTRSELHSVFAQYGFIKSCWLRMGEKGPNRTPTPTYAFVTFSNPADAHKALQAPAHEKSLRDRNLRISPADSWHQPIEESDENYKPPCALRPPMPPQSVSVRTRLGDIITVQRMPEMDCIPTTSNDGTTPPPPPEAEPVQVHHEYVRTKEHIALDELTADYIDYTGFKFPTLAELKSDAPLKPPPRQKASGSAFAVVPKSSHSETPRPKTPDTGLPPGVNMLNILNRDCLIHIIRYIPLRDLIRSERVCKSWQDLVQEHLEGIRVFKTSWWQHVPVMLTTAILRRVLQRVGNSLTRLHIDHHLSALNDRTAHTVGKFCPILEDLKIVGMHTRNWNPLIYGCTELKSLAFVSCNKLTDSSLVHLVKCESSIESLTIANNTHVTGLFLTGNSSPNLNTLAFYNCYSLQGTVICAAVDNLPGLTTLKLDVCPHTMWKVVPMILKKLPKLVELSLSEYISVEMCFSPECNEQFCNALSNLSELKILNLNRNIYITNNVLTCVAQYCPKLEAINVSSCNSRRIFPYPGVSDEGVAALCGGCRALEVLEVSYLSALSDAGLSAAAGLPNLRRITARGNPALSAAPLAECLAACPLLQEIDVCGCDCISEEVVSAALRALEKTPRLVKLHLAGTAAASDIVPDLVKHKLLIVDVVKDRSNPHLRPDFVDHIFEDESDESLGDIYDHEDFDEFFGPDDEEYMEDDIDNFDEIF